MHQTLLIITGTSGAGKTLLIENLKQRYGNGHVLTVTTRPRKPHEAVDAYHFVSDAELDRMEERGETIWVIGRYGNRYSITKAAILNPLLSNDGVAFVAITPDYHEFLAVWSKKNSITPINVHLVAPHPEEQIRRLTNRDGELFDRARIDPDVNAKFEIDAITASMGTPLHFIKQDTPEVMLEKVENLIDTARA